MLHRNKFVLRGSSLICSYCSGAKRQHPLSFSRAFSPCCSMFNAATLICFEKYGLSMWILSISRLRGAAHFLTKRCWRKRPGLSKPWMRIEGKHCNPQHMDRSLCIFDRNLSQLSRSQYLLSTKKIANVSGKKGKLSWNLSWIIG